MTITSSAGWSNEGMERDRRALLEWYQSVKRDLPWRKNRDAYRIWISEVMLQQTTVAAVVPYYERFIARFPDIASLAASRLEDVFELWAGLGYYSRARNLHRAATQLNVRFPETAKELLEVSGFGPYTANAVASLAFSEKCGVLDGNVIRVLSRRLGLSLEWWKPRARERLQDIADQLAQVENPSDLNQAMMELGATVCTPQSPSCLLCPWSRTCRARKLGEIDLLPLKRPKREREIWQWRPTVITEAKRVYVIENDYAPFLRGHWILPGEVKRLNQKPKTYAYKGSVTHHDIFVSPQIAARKKPAGGKWVRLDDLKRSVPTSLVRKAVASALKVSFT